MTERRGIGGIFALAMVASPFLALLYGWEAALAALIAALLATAYLAGDGARQAADDPGRRRRLVAAGVVNVVLAVIAVAILVARLR